VVWNKRGVKVQGIERKIALIVAAALVITAPVFAAPQKRPVIAKKRPTPASMKPVSAPASAPIPAPSATLLATPIGNPGDWFPPEAYPAAARIKAEEGRTGFSLDIDPAGRITACNIVSSSGSDLLDSQTCSQLIANGQFKPARDASGRAVSGKWHSAMRWKLLEGAATEE